MRLTLVIFFCFLLVATKGQEASFRFNNYSLEDGLSQSTVYAFLEDDLGYIWIGTRDGLNRFDANTFVKFYPSFDGKNSLSYRSVRALAKDKDGFIWVGTDGGGVDRLDPKTNLFTKLCELVESKVCGLETNITSLEVVNNDLLIGTRNLGFYRFDLKNQSLQKELELTNTIWDIKYNNGKTVLATSNGIIVIDSLGNNEHLRNQEIKTIKFINDRKILLGSRNSGVLIFDLISGRITSFNRELSSIEVSSLEIDNEEQIWITTDSEGIFLAKLSGELIHHFKALNQQPNHLRSNSIRTVFKDSNGTIWIGTNNSGLSNYFKYRYQFNGYSSLTTKGELPTDIILSFNELDNGNILIGTEQHGLVVLNSEDQSFSINTAFKNESVIAIEKDQKGHIWVATDGSGLRKLENQNDLEKVKEIGNLTDQSVLSLEVSTSGDIIAGLYKGFNIIMDDRVLKMDFVPEYLQMDRILALDYLSDTEFLLGTFANGLVYFNREDKSFKRFNSILNDGTRKPERVQVIYTDSKNRIWLGSYSGLYLFDKETEAFKSFTTKEGLPSDVVYGILEDSNHMLWLSTNSGISKFDPEAEIFLNYSLSDGLLSNEFNGGAYFIDTKGKMYFGGVKGFTVFNPLEIKESYLPSKVVVYAMNVDGDIYNTLLEDEIRLNDRQDFIQFDFSYLNYVNAEKYTLEYKLSGLSENWIPINNRRSVNFSGLSPGNYNFQIRTINNIKEVTAYSENVNFHINPPLWKTWYFILSVILLMAGLMYALFRYRMFYVLKEEETRNRIARDLHDDLSATLSSISFFSEAAKREKETSASHSRFLKRIDESALEAKEKINDIIWAIDPGNDDWNAFIAKCKRYAAEMFESKNIDYAIEIDDSIITISNLALRQDLWLIFKEITTNVVRHSKATRAKVSLKKQGKTLYMSIEDNGIGLQTIEQKKGNGISNLKYRADKMHADLKFEPVTPSGTRWKFEISV